MAKRTTSRASEQVRDMRTLARAERIASGHLGRPTTRLPNRKAVNNKRAARGRVEY